MQIQYHHIWSLWTGEFDMENIIDIAREYHLRVIEDATEALGTKYEIGRYAEKYALYAMGIPCAINYVEKT